MKPEQGFDRHFVVQYGELGTSSFAAHEFVLNGQEREHRGVVIQQTQDAAHDRILCFFLYIFYSITLYEQRFKEFVIE